MDGDATRNVTIRTAIASARRKGPITASVVWVE